LNDLRSRAFGNAALAGASFAPASSGLRGMMNRNVLSLAVGALAVCVVILGYKVYQDNRQPKGVQINIGQGGISVEKK
jgi:hypothetical protein